MGEYRRDTRLWPHIWFAQYAILYGFPLLFLATVFYDREGWFLGLSVYLTFAVAFLAWRAANERVGKWWRIALGSLMLGGWTFCLLAVYAGPGPTKMCWPRYVIPHRWATPQNIGPDPNCDGVTLEELKAD